VTTPGDVERVPLKVVPYYVQPLEDEPEVVVQEEPPADRPRVKSPWLGIGALALAVVTVVLHAWAIGSSTDGDFALGSGLGWAAIVVSGIAFLAGIVAIVLGCGRRFGIAAAVLALVANPYLLLVVLRWASGG